jgi:hypothetical protein
MLYSPEPPMIASVGIESMDILFPWKILFIVLESALNH